MEIIQLIVMAIGFMSLFVYQHYKIKNLEDRTTTQSKLLKDIKTFIDIFNPELIKYRVELYEKTLEKEKDLNLKQIQQQLSQDMEAKLKRDRDRGMKVAKSFGVLIQAFIQALYYLPHERRKALINEMQDDELKKAFQPGLPFYEKFDREKYQGLLYGLEKGG